MNLAIATIVNSGKTPAREVIALFGLRFQDPSYVLQKGDADWMNHTFDQIESGLIKPDQQSGTFAQGNLKLRYPVKPPHMHDETIEKISLGVLPPGIPKKFIHPDNWLVYSTSPSDVPDVVVYGRITYSDVFGNKRVTSFCGYRSNSSGTDFSVCPVFNDMK